jgi:hypothetical protein
MKVKEADKKLSLVKDESFFESIPENIRLLPQGILPSGALSAHPTILSLKRINMKIAGEHNVLEPILEK